MSCPAGIKRAATRLLWQRRVRPRQRRILSSVISQESTSNAPLTSIQFKQQFICAAVPMIGFGIMDQTIMVHAGDLIDNNLGVTLGIATMQAAAFGQLLSDTSGVIFGNTMESWFAKMGLPYPNLSSEQRRSNRFRFATTLGAACGVALGCIIGMLNFLFIDCHRAERIKRHKELEVIFEMVMRTGPQLFRAERISLFLYDETTKVFFSRAISGQSDIIEVPFDRGLVGYVWRTGQTINLPDAYNSPYFDQRSDKVTGYRTKQVLAAPVWSLKHSNTLDCEVCLKGPRIKALLMVLNTVNNKPFTEHDERMMQMLQDHVRIFMEVFEHDSVSDIRKEPPVVIPDFKVNKISE